MVCDSVRGWTAEKMSVPGEAQVTENPDKGTAVLVQSDEMKVVITSLDPEGVMAQVKSSAIVDGVYTTVCSVPL